jgi:hypothetical protein
VGIVTQDEVRALQTKVSDYFQQLNAVIAQESAKGDFLPHHNEQFSAQTWADLAGRVAEYTAESPSLIFTGGQWDRGRELIEQLDKWRDYLASSRGGQGPMPNVPAPMPVPQSEVSVFGGGLATIALVVLAIVMLKK